MFDASTPPRMSITNLRSGAEVVAFFNPPEWDESVQPSWARLAPQGNSHEVHHFQNTSPYELKFTLYFRAGSPDELLAMQRARRHLLSWAYPMRTSDDTLGGAPPKLLLVWPRMLCVEVFLTGCRIKHQRFNSAGMSVQFDADVTFEESLESLLTSGYVAEDPEQRFGEVSLEDLEL